MTSGLESARRDDLREFLEADLRKDLLRFTTAGSVDDGKSTLIGRLLHDSKGIYEDQLAAVRKSRVNRSGKAIDFSLLTDGLRAEREQGITIDVAYRYFSTPRRKFIIADTPGHEQYTRNMATGASTADLAIVLVDATKGVLPQTRRHTYIASLLGIPHVVAAVNKMDLVEYREEPFLALAAEFSKLARSLRVPFVQCIPISALEGDNVVASGSNMPWYLGPTLIEYLETVEIRASDTKSSFRFPIQYVIRPDSNFRGFAGRVAGGEVRPGDEVLALPSGRRTRVRAVVCYDGELETAFPPQSVVLTLSDEIDLSRGDMLVSPGALPLVSKKFVAMVVWLDAKPLRLQTSYLLKHAGRLVKGKACRIRFRVDVNDLTEIPAGHLDMNAIACVEFETNNPLFFDPYRNNRTTGSLVLIDPLSNATVGAGMILERTQDVGEDREPVRTSPLSIYERPVSPRERYERHGHRPGLFLINEAIAVPLERALFSLGFETIRLQGDRIPPGALPSVVSVLLSAGSIILCSRDGLSHESRSVAESISGKFFFDLVSAPMVDAQQVLEQVLEIAQSLRSELQSDKKEEEN